MKQLKVLAKNKGIPKYYKMLKAELIKALTVDYKSTPQKS